MHARSYCVAQEPGAAQSGRSARMAVGVSAAGAQATAPGGPGATQIAIPALSEVFIGVT